MTTPNPHPNQVKSWKFFTSILSSKSLNLLEGKLIYLQSCQMSTKKILAPPHPDKITKLHHLYYPSLQPFGKLHNFFVGCEGKRLQTSRPIILLSDYQYIGTIVIIDFRSSSSSSTHFGVITMAKLCMGHASRLGQKSR